MALLVVAVKAYDLEAALDRVAPEALDGAVVLPLLNGLEHVEAIRGRLEPLATVCCKRRPLSPPGRSGACRRPRRNQASSSRSSRREGESPQRRADLDHVTLAARLEPLATAGLELVVRDDEQEVLWEKAARLAVLAAATVASGRPIGGLREDPAWRPRLRDGLDEAVAAAAAEGVALAAADQWAIIEAMPPEVTTSAARDAAAGRPTELDAIAGSVVRAGRRHGVPMPALERLLRDAEEATAR